MQVPDHKAPHHPRRAHLPAERQHPHRALSRPGLGFATQGGDGRYGLRPGNTPEAYGPIGFALHTQDFYDGSSNECGCAASGSGWTACLFSSHLDHGTGTGSGSATRTWTTPVPGENDMEYHRCCYRMPGNDLKFTGTSPPRTVHPGAGLHPPRASR